MLDIFSVFERIRNATNDPDAEVRMRSAVDGACIQIYVEWHSGSGRNGIHMLVDELNLRRAKYREEYIEHRIQSLVSKIEESHRMEDK